MEHCARAVGIPRLWEQIHPHSLASQPPLQMRTDAVLIHEWACKIVLKCSCLIKGTLIKGTLYFTEVDVNVYILMRENVFLFDKTKSIDMEWK